MNGDAVTQKLEKILLNHPDLVMQTLKETLKENADIIEKTRMQILGVSFFIIIFSWLNLICYIYVFYCYQTQRVCHVRSYRND